MDSSNLEKKVQSLTQEAFDLLLARLDTDREKAGQMYEGIRLKLIKYFAWRGALMPDREADETINRVAKKMKAGEEIYNLNAYFYGVARMVFAESLKAQEREREALNQVTILASPPIEDDLNALQKHACLSRCLQQLPRESYHLIIEYYQDDKGAKIKCRKRLASRLNIPLNALRIRVHRIRLSLEACVRECLNEAA